MPWGCFCKVEARGVSARCPSTLVSLLGGATEEVPHIGKKHFQEHLEEQAFELCFSYIMWEAYSGEASPSC